MSDCSSCPSKGKCGNDSGNCGVKINPLNKIKNVIGVMSGKGGVGKSTVSAYVAKSLAKQGYKVGLMDADIMGPSAGRLMGVAGQRAYAENDMIVPVVNEDGVKVVSLNMMLGDENQPVVWRGAMLSSCVTQFWSETNWGELDYLVVDMPPGTGDITLTVMQSIPLTGVIMVTIPQDMVGMIVNKSINMAKLLNVEVIGVVENMSYMLCPHCGERIEVFSRPKEAYVEADIICSLPMDSSVSAMTEGEALKEEIDKQFALITKRITDFSK